MTALLFFSSLKIEKQNNPTPSCQFFVHHISALATTALGVGQDLGRERDNIGKLQTTPIWISAQLTEDSVIILYVEDRDLRIERRSQ